MLWFVLAALVAGITQRLHAGFFVLAIVAARACVRPDRRAWAVVVGLSTCAGLYGFLHSRAHEADVACMSEWARGSERTALSGWVCGFPRTSFYGTSFLFATRCHGKPLRVLVYATRFNVNYGDSLRLDAEPARRRGAAPLRGLGIGGVVRVRAGGLHRLPGHAGDPWRRRLFWPAHRAVRLRLQRALGRHSGLPIALVLGERGLSRRGLDERIRRLGISHLFALSGLHLGVIIGWVLLGAGRAGLGRTPRALAIAAVLVAYTGFVGEIESLRRATAMALLLVLARACDRRTTAADALMTAFFLLLLVSPNAIFSVAFQLSFAATAAIILIGGEVQGLHNRIVRARRSLARRCVGAVIAGGVVSAAIQIIVAPLQIHYFAHVSTMGPVATIVFLPAVLAVIVTGLAAAILAPVPVVGTAAVVCAELVSRATAAALFWAGAVAPPLLAAPSPNLWLWGVAILWWYRRRRRPRSALAGAAVIMALALQC